MIASRATVTGQGGATSHAAVVSRALGRPCVVGCGDAATALVGRIVTVDGGAGIVYDGVLSVEAPDERSDTYLRRLIEWARARSKIAVWHPDEAPALHDMVDLDKHPEGAELERLASLLHAAKAAHGAVLANPDAVVIAAKQGVTALVTSPVLPALLTVLQWQRDTATQHLNAGVAA
jgi:pyruvate,orthophosphate dikinase